MHCVFQTEPAAHTCEGRLIIRTVIYQLYHWKQIGGKAINSWSITFIVIFLSPVLVSWQLYCLTNEKCEHIVHDI